MRGSLVPWSLALLSLSSFAQEGALSQTKLINAGGSCSSSLNCTNLAIVQGGSGMISFAVNVGPNCYIGQNCGFGTGSSFTVNGATYTDFIGSFKFKDAKSCGAGHTCYCYQITGRFNVHDLTSQSIVINGQRGGHTITGTGGSVVLK